MLYVVCCVVLCYAAAPIFGCPGTPPVRCCNLQCTIQGPLCVNENNGCNGCKLQCTIQGPLCVNENNVYNVAREYIIGIKQQAKN